MKKITQKVGWLLAGMVLLSSCDKQNEVEPTDQEEYKFVRVIVSDELTNQISVVNPREGEIETFTAQYPKSALYTTESGRFGVLVHRADNRVQLFDTGLESHGDHVDVKGTPKWASLVGESLLPTHFKSKGNEIMLFNDGDGSISVGKEEDFHVAGKQLTRINTGNTAHHGAMVKFNNGLYAITLKDGSVAGTLPEKVRIMDATGKEVYPASVQTKGIHGNASDGNVAVFGSASGMLVVEANGDQRLIAHPADFGTAWFGTIMEAGIPGKFLGYTASKGVYLIDVATEKVTPLIQSEDLMQVVTDQANQRLIALAHNGEVKIIDIASNNVIKSGSILPPTAKDDSQKPQLKATNRYLYLTQPKTGELLMIRTENFSDTKRLKVSATPYRLSILGIESSEAH